MTRINVYEVDEFTREQTKLGWFDPDTAEKVEGRREWDGNNMADVHAGANRWQTLYRTRSGRYVIRQESAWTTEQTTYRFVTADDAREWLLADESDELVEKWFGEIEDERGPGRPEIGPPIKIRLGEELTAKVAAATLEGESQAAAIRRLLAERLA